MPLIGTGKHRFPEDVVLRVMREEFEKFSSMYLPGTLKEIKLVRFDQSMRQTVPAQPVSGKLLKKSYQILLRPRVLLNYINSRLPLQQQLISKEGVRILKRKLYTYNTNEDNKHNTRYLNCNKKKRIISGQTNVGNYGIVNI